MRTLLFCGTLTLAVATPGQAQEARRPVLQTESNVQPTRKQEPVYRTGLQNGQRRAAPAQGKSFSKGTDRIKKASISTNSKRTLRTISPRTAGSDAKAKNQPASTQDAIKRMIGSLAVVLGSFFVLVWFIKRKKTGANHALSEQVIEVLGQMPMNGRQQMQLMRIGSKLLLLYLTPNSAQTLTEITDPLEVERLSAQCRSRSESSISSSFRQVLEQMGNEPASGFLDQHQRTQLEMAGGSSRSFTANA